MSNNMVGMIRHRALVVPRRHLEKTDNIMRLVRFLVYHWV